MMAVARLEEDAGQAMKWAKEEFRVQIDRATGYGPPGRSGRRSRQCPDRDVMGDY